MRIITLAMAGLVLLPTAALAQSRTYPDNMGCNTGRSVTRGNTTTVNMGR
jgi:hypothetical protein